MRCNAFHPFDCMSVNARDGHVVVKPISLDRGQPRNAKPSRLSPNGTLQAASHGNLALTLYIYTV
jgi:hypothetical protein